MGYFEDLWYYNSIDAAATLDINRELGSEADETYKMTLRLLEPLISMMTTGVRIDKPALQRTKEEVESECQKLQEELDEMCGRPLNVNSTKDMQAYFYDELRIPPYKSRETGRPTCDDKALTRLAKGTSARAGRPEAQLAQKIRGLRKLSSTYLNISFDADDRLRCSYNIRGTKFGRLSSSKTIHGTGMNMQNLPEAFLSFLIADPGKTLIQLDKSGAEWVVVAYLAEDPLMIETAEMGKDPHLQTALLMFGLPEEAILEENEAIGHSTNPTEIERIREGLGPTMKKILRSGAFLPRNMSMRQAAKKANHGLNYDEGYGEFAFQNEIVDADAKRIVEMYHDAYPGIRNKFHFSVLASLNTDRTLRNCFGREIKLRDRWGRDLWKSAYSALPQSTVVDLVNQGMCEIYEDSAEHMKEVDLLMQVHDSILLQAPSATFEKDIRIYRSCLKALNPTLTYGGRDFHIRTDVKIGQNARDLTAI